MAAHIEGRMHRFTVLGWRQPGARHQLCGRPETLC